MNKKKFKGGIRLQQTKIIIKPNYTLDGVNNDNVYKTGKIETEDNQEFILYKITDIANYTGNSFILPDIKTDSNSTGNINLETLKDIYLFGYLNKNTLFVKKNTSSKPINDQLNHIGKNLNLLFKEISDEKLKINIILIYNKKNNFLIIIFDMKNKHYKKFESSFSPAFFVSDEKLKKKINKLYLKILIEYTYKKISDLRNQEINFDYINTQFNDRRLNELVLFTEDEKKKEKRKNIKSDIKNIKKVINKIENNILKNSEYDGLNDEYNNLKQLINKLKTDFEMYVKSVNGLSVEEKNSLTAFSSDW